jgi:hypothetical protein
MALFTDGPIATTDDLVGHDSSVLTVASTEGIDLTRKLALAMNELALELTSLVPALEGLNRVAVTPAIQIWHIFRTLELVYRDAYQNQLNDRYAGKRDQFAALGKWALDKVMEGGVGMINNPIPKATPADLTYFPGQQAGATYYVCISWTGGQNEEGAVGEWSAISTPDGNILSARAVNPPSNAAGWNVFVGLAPDSISQQNPSPLPLGQAWLQQSAVSTNGRVPHTGQGADYIRTVARILRRG